VVYQECQDDMGKCSPEQLSNKTGYTRIIFTIQTTHYTFCKVMAWCKWRFIFLRDVCGWWRYH